MELGKNIGECIDAYDVLRNLPRLLLGRTRGGSVAGLFGIIVDR